MTGEGFLRWSPGVLECREGLVGSATADRSAKPANPPPRCRNVLLPACHPIGHFGDLLGVPRERTGRLWGGDSRRQDPSLHAPGLGDRSQGWRILDLLLPEGPPRYLHPVRGRNRRRRGLRHRRGRGPDRQQCLLPATQAPPAKFSGVSPRIFSVGSHGTSIRSPTGDPAHIRYPPSRWCRSEKTRKRTTSPTPGPELKPLFET